MKLPRANGQMLTAQPHASTLPSMTGAMFAPEPGCVRLFEVGRPSQAETFLGLRLQVRRAQRRSSSEVPWVFPSSSVGVGGIVITADHHPRAGERLLECKIRTAILSDVNPGERVGLLKPVGAPYPRC